MSASETIAPGTAVAHSLELVCFHVGIWRMGVVASQVSGALRDEQGIPIEQLLHLPPGSAAGRQSLVIRQSGTPLLVAVDRPVDLITLPVAAIHPLPPLLAARTRLHGLRALAMMPGQPSYLILLLDLAACVTT